MYCIQYILAINLWACKMQEDPVINVASYSTYGLRLCDSYVRIPATSMWVSTAGNVFTFIVTRPGAEGSECLLLLGSEWGVIQVAIWPSSSIVVHVLGTAIDAIGRIVEATS